MSLSGAGIYSEVYIKIPGSSFNPFLRPFRSLATTGNSFTLRFNTDGATTRSGYALEWSCPTAAVEKMNIPEVRVGPNPASDLLYIKFLQKADRECTIRLMDVSGHLIEKIKLLNQDDTTLDVSILIPGIYLLEIRSGTSVSTRKIAIE